MRVEKDEIKQIKDGVFLIWKELGMTPLQVLQRVRGQLELSDDVSMTYAGRLDPAAQGELLVLVGETCKRKDEFLGADKTYRFKVLLGFETDTLDLLGLVTKFGRPTSTFLDVGRPNQLIGRWRWSYPAYSSRPVDGKPLWQWAREGKYQELLDQGKVPVNEFEIKDLQFFGQSTISKDELLRYIVILAKKIEGDFRQGEIIRRWQEVLAETQTKDFQLLEFEITVTSGGYVRQITEKIGEILDVPTTTFSITRTKIHLK